MLHLQQSNSVCYSKKKKKFKDYLHDVDDDYVCVCVHSVYTSNTSMVFDMMIISNKYNNRIRERKKKMIANCKLFFIFGHYIFDFFPISLISP